MARKRKATARLALLGRDAIERALEASREAGSDARFYALVAMRNPSRSHWVRWAGRSHSLKAIVARALQEQEPELRSTDFHAADAAARLKELGFDVDHAGAA